jgi:hypothetical protein
MSLCSTADTRVVFSSSDAIEEDTDRIGRELPRGKLLSTLSSPAILFANHAAPCRQALGGMLLHPLIELRRAYQAGLHRDVSEVRGGDGLLVAICRRGKTAEYGDHLDQDRRAPPLRWYWRRWPDDLPVPCPAAR